MRYIIIAILCLIFVITIHQILSDPGTNMNCVQKTEGFDDYNFGSSTNIDDPDGVDGTSTVNGTADTPYIDGPDGTITMDGMSGTDDMSYMDNIDKAMGLSGRPGTGSIKGTARFRITKPESVQYLYKLLYILDKVFHQNNLEYWMDGGTLLGAVRHKGIIPWDDDGDVQIWKKDETKLKQLKDVFLSYDVVLMPTWFGYKIFYTYGKSIKGYKWKYPAIDIFIMEEKNGRIVYSYPKAQNAFGKCYFESETMYPLEKYRFGSFELSGVAKGAVKKYFDTCYGSDWSTHAYQMFDHENEKAIEHEKVLLSEDEKRPAQPIEFKKF